MENINGLAAAIHANAVEHGWWEKERNEAEIFALIQSELSEGLEEYRENQMTLYFACDLEGVEGGNHCAEYDHDCAYRPAGEGFCKRAKPEGIAIELADCVIRILDYCGRQKIDIGAELEARKAGYIAYPLPELVAECHYLVSMAYKNEEPRPLYFAEVIALVEYWCTGEGHDLGELIRLKHEYNKGRPYRHGGKVC